MLSLDSRYKEERSSSCTSEIRDFTLYYINNVGMTCSQKPTTLVVGVLRAYHFSEIDDFTFFIEGTIAYNIFVYPVLN